MKFMGRLDKFLLAERVVFTIWSLSNLHPNVSLYLIEAENDLRDECVIVDVVCSSIFLLRIKTKDEKEYRSVTNTIFETPEQC